MKKAPWSRGSTGLGTNKLDPGHAGFPGGLGHRLGHGGRHAAIQRTGDDVLGGQLIVGDERGDGFRRRDLHLVVDVAGPHVQSAPEDAREG